MEAAIDRMNANLLNIAPRSARENQ